MDYEKIFNWAKENGLALTVTYWEADNTHTVESISAAKSECLVIKRCYTADQFIERWENETK